MSSTVMGRLGESLSKQIRPLQLSSLLSKHLPACRASSSRIPLTFFEADSLEDCGRNEPSGTIVAVKEGGSGSASNVMHGIGFYDPSELCVEVFHWSDTNDIVFPITDVRFFHEKIMSAIKRRASHLGSRRNAASTPPDTAIRLFHGAADGIPSLYVSLLGSRAQIVATSSSAEQLIPLTELLLAKALEVTDCYVYSPSEVFHVADRVSRNAAIQRATELLADSNNTKNSNTTEPSSILDDMSEINTRFNNQTFSRADPWNTFTENGVSYPVPSQGMLPSIKGVKQLLSLTTYPLFPLHHAASRAALPLETKGKVVLLMGLEEGVLGMLMNILGAAEKVIVATDSHSLKLFLRERVTYHFNESVFAQIQFIRRADIRPEVFTSDLGVNYVGISGMSVGSSLVASRVEVRGATQLMDMIEHTLECMQWGKGVFRGSLVVQCGGNALGVHRPSRGGLVKGPLSFLKAAISEAVSGTHAKFRDRSRIALVQRKSFTRTPTFPHGSTLLDDADKVGIERWEPVFCDAIFDVVEEEHVEVHKSNVLGKK